MAEQKPDSGKWRDRKYRLLLYPDDPTHEACMRKLEAGGYRFAAIKHDSDTWEQGEDDRGDHEVGSLKKEHWHVVVKFPQAKWSTALAKELGIKGNYIRKCDNLDGALTYLVHEGFPDKYQYPLEAVFGPLAPSVAKLLIADDINERVLQIVDMIDEEPGKVRFREMLIKVCRNGLFGEYRLLGQGFFRLLDEHNEDFSEGKLLERKIQMERFAEQVKNPDRYDSVTRCEASARYGLPSKSLNE